jgi:hypothetical protein
MLKGQYNLADKLSEKTVCLITEKSKLLHPLDSHNSKELRSAVGNACGSNSRRCIS